MAAYRRVDDLRSPAGWLPVHRDQLGANARYRVLEAFTFLVYTRPNGTLQNLMVLDYRPSKLSAQLHTKEAWLSNLVERVAVAKQSDFTSFHLGLVGGNAIAQGACCGRQVTQYHRRHAASLRALQPGALMGASTSRSSRLNCRGHLYQVVRQF